MRYMDRKYGLGKTKNICGGRRKKQKTKKKKCIKKNKYSVRIDPGYPDKYRGWYDVQKCGKCQIIVDGLVTVVQEEIQNLEQKKK